MKEKPVPIYDILEFLEKKIGDGQSTNYFNYWESSSKELMFKPEKCFKYMDILDKLRDKGHPEKETRMQLDKWFIEIIVNRFPELIEYSIIIQHTKEKLGFKKFRYDGFDQTGYHIKIKDMLK